MRGQDPHAGRAAEAPVERLEAGGGVGQAGGPGRQRGQGGVDVGRQFAGVGRGGG